MEHLGIHTTPGTAANVLDTLMGNFAVELDCLNLGVTRV